MGGPVSHRVLYKEILWDTQSLMVFHIGQASLPVKGRETVGKALPL